jgi:hypothetical protein
MTTHEVLQFLKLYFNSKHIDCLMADIQRDFAKLVTYFTFFFSVVVDGLFGLDRLSIWLIWIYLAETVWFSLRWFLAKTDVIEFSSFMIIFWVLLNVECDELTDRPVI